MLLGMIASIVIPPVVAFFLCENYPVYKIRKFLKGDKL